MSRASSAPTLGDVVEGRDSLPGMSDFYKDLKREMGISSVADLVPLSTQNDPVYLQPANIEKAEWFAEIWEREGCPEFHPRGFYYDIFGKGYERPNGEPVENSSETWVDIQKGAKYAQILGLVPGEKVRDEKNPDPTLTVGHEEVPLEEQREVGWGAIGPLGVSTVEMAGYSAPEIPSGFSWGLPELEPDDTDELLDEVADWFVDGLFSAVEYETSKYQPYYLEVWAEKGGLLPKDLLREYGATIRPAGGGEFSLSMCRDAVKRADERDQGLVVVLVTDYDPKGMDMPKSAARKIELEAVARDVEAHVHHGALTAEQVEEYGLPGEPGKVPEGDSHGAKAYESHKELFRQAEGYPVEVNAFVGREPQAFRDDLGEYLAPYYDDELGQRIDDALEDARERAKEEYKAQVDAEAVAEHLRRTREAIEAYRDDMADLFDEAKDTLEELRERHTEVHEKTQLREHSSDLTSAVKVDPADVVDGVTRYWSPPTGRAERPPAEPLLDTRRPIAKQIEAYQAADIRYQGGGRDV